MGSIQEAHCVSAPIDLQGKQVELLLNIEGLGEHSRVTVEVLDERFNPLESYEADACLAPTQSGFEQAVRWQECVRIEHKSGPVRVRVNFAGLRAEDVKLYAIYLREAEG
jgi:hypothetical protein